MTWKYQICLPMKSEPSLEHTTVDVIAKWIMLDIRDDLKETLYGVMSNAYTQLSKEDAKDRKIDFVSARNNEGAIATCSIEAQEHRSEGGATISAYIKIQNPSVEITANKVIIDASGMPQTVRGRIKVGDRINDIVDFHLIKDRVIQEITIVEDDIYIDLVEQEPENWYDAFPDFTWL